MKTLKSQKKILIDKGYLVLTFSNKSIKILNNIRHEVLKVVKKKNKKITSLEKSHKFLNEKEFETTLYEVTKMMWKKDTFTKLFQNESEKLNFFFGTDLDLQSYPHIRATRPGISGDNIGLHRDIDYGASIYENSLWVPITKINKGGGMSLLSDSIYKGYKGFKHIKKIGEKRNSKKNISGYPHTLQSVYLNKSMRDKLVEPKLKKNQYMIIPQFMVHGSEMNSSNFTRWSFDIRICNSLYNDPRSSLERKRKKIVKKKGGYPYYKPLTRSATSVLTNVFLRK